MFRYDFRCTNDHADCGFEIETSDKDGPHFCPLCESPMKRVWSLFNSAKIQIEPVWNPALGQYVTSESDMESKFRKLSDEHSARLNTDVKYSPVDLHESSTIGVTEDGLESTYRREHNQKAKENGSHGNIF